MPTLVLHLSLGLMMAIALRLDLLSTLIVLFSSVVPDLDVILNEHRSISHSLLVVVPLVVFFRFLSGVWKVRLVVCILAYVFHLVMDSLGSPAPLLWPFLRDYLRIILRGYIEFVKSFSIRFELRVVKVPPPRKGSSGGPLFEGYDLLLLVFLTITYLLFVI